MNRITGVLAAGMVAAIALGGAMAVNADDTNIRGQRNAYKVNLLVSDLSDAPVMDTRLKNAWGVAFSPAGSPFWIADNATGLSTLYDGTGAIQSLVVTIPCPTGQDSNCTAAPTGIVWNPSAAFLVPGTQTQAAFIFATEDGTISAWAKGLTPPDNAVIAADNSTTGAVYKGIAFGVNVNGAFLFATNFHAGTVDVFGPPRAGSPTGLYEPATTDGGFVDPNIPAGFAPFGIQNINGDLFVTYAKQDDQKHDDVAGLGNGFVDVFDTDGHLLRRLASGGTLNSPWGVARASFAFGRFSGDILIGNFGDGRINVVTGNGRSLDQLKGSDGKPLAIEGLWTLTLGGGAKSSPDTLYFTAGPNDEKDGLFGTITPAQRQHMAGN